MMLDLLWISERGQFLLGLENASKEQSSKVSYHPAYLPLESSGMMGDKALRKMRKFGIYHWLFSQAGCFQVLPLPANM